MVTRLESALWATPAGAGAPFSHTQFWMACVSVAGQTVNIRANIRRPATASMRLPPTSSKYVIGEIFKYNLTARYKRW